MDTNKKHSKDWSFLFPLPPIALLERGHTLKGMKSCTEKKCKSCCILCSAWTTLIGVLARNIYISSLHLNIGWDNQPWALSRVVIRQLTSWSGLQEVVAKGFHIHLLYSWCRLLQKSRKISSSWIFPRNIADSLSDLIDYSAWRFYTQTQIKTGNKI